ncbi:sigma-54 dependent transcriptional regulator, partial [Bdellovibrionota bacterium FG-1]
MKSDLEILIVEDSDAFRESVVQLLSVFMNVDGRADLKSAKEALKTKTYDVVILDKRLPDGDGTTLIKSIKEDNPNTVVIILTEDKEASSGKRCMMLGADDYVVKSEGGLADLLIRIPFVVERAADTRSLISLKEQVRTAFKYEIIGSSPSTAALREHILSVKGAMSNFLITGESGTGKELIARRINALSDGKQRPLVVLNCAAIPENLIEEELFGHQKGTFTGATSDRPGKFELAHDGDIFLDEIGDLPYEAQSKILRVIEDGTYFRVGGTKPIHTNCRVIAATNKNLEEMVRQKQFRQDLFYRLSIVRLQTTPLRERLADIPALAQHFCRSLDGPTLKISDRAVRKLMQHEWPGNIRELGNSIERAFLRVRHTTKNGTCGPKIIEAEDISFDHVSGPAADIRTLESKLPTELPDLNNTSYAAFMDAAERAYLTSAISVTNG